MRVAMQHAVGRLIENNADTMLLLVDIGVWPFRNLLAKHPNRVKNIGIFEPGTISIAAGLAISGIIPTIYGISPFIVQRAVEQLKLDFVYQKIGGNFITTGASYDFSTLGYSHYCPEDVATLSQLPGMEIITPGTCGQFETLWNRCSENGNATYFRMTDYCNKNEVEVKFGRATVVKQGNQATVIAVAETLDMVISACMEQDVTILYYTTIAPFDEETLQQNCASGKILICEPFYKGTLISYVMDALHGKQVLVSGVGVPKEILRNYGRKTQNDAYCGLNAETIHFKVTDLIRNGFHEELY